MNRVTHFEIYTDDPKKVQPFYQDVFGWKFPKFEGGPIEYWLVTTGDDKEPGINGGMTRPRQGQTATRTKSQNDQHDRGQISGSNHQEDRATRRENLCPENGDPESRVADLRGGSGRQRLWNYRAGYKSEVIGKERL
jgi:catechol 2,3-dioxygenase-like lactoylglutathione lyase family enzyme